VLLYVYPFDTQVIAGDRGLTLDKVQLDMLGTAKKVSHISYLHF